MAFSVRWLLLAVAFIGLIVAGMLYATQHWVAGINGVFLLASLSCIVVAIYGRASQRAFAVGFLCFGLPYFIVANRIIDAIPENFLALDSALRELHPHVIRLTETPTPENSGFYTDPEIAAAVARRDGFSRLYKPGMGVFIQTVRPIEADFFGLGRAFCAILMGVMGGFLASALRKRNFEITPTTQHVAAS
jgi:hypothetical protein